MDFFQKINLKFNVNMHPDGVNFYGKTEKI